MTAPTRTSGVDTSITRSEVIDMRRAHDVIIIGGGAAGLSAALVLGRARRRVVVIDAGTPRNAPAAHMQGYLSRDGLPPADLVAFGRAEVTGYGVELVDDTVTAIDMAVTPYDEAAPQFTVTVAGGSTFVGRQILVTTGLIDDLPELPGIRERWGRDVLHCPYCHGWEVRDRRLGVLGTHAAAGTHAQLIRQWSDDVTFFVHTYDLDHTERAAMEARGIRIVTGEIDRLVIENDHVTSVRLVDGSLVDLDAVFVRPGTRPRPDGLLARLGCEPIATGFVGVDPAGRTAVPGVWAAGNAVDPRAQVITAAGQGSAVAIGINSELTDDDIRQALRWTTQFGGVANRSEAGAVARRLGLD